MNNLRIIKDRIAGNIILILTIFISSIIFLIFISLLYKSWPILGFESFNKIIFSSEWKPMQKKFGLLPFIAGTVYVTVLSLIIAVPVCILTSIFLAEYAHVRFQKSMNVVIDMLAGIPSVVYGIWGVIMVVPLIKNHIAPFFNTNTTGYSLLAGSIVLAIMIFPVIIQISVEVLTSVPVELREASLALGATKWQTIKLVVLRKAMPGVAAAVILGLSRALGETMAVLMVIGNTVKIPKSVFDPAYPLPALIANNYGEMLSIPLYDSAIMLSALILFLVIIFFNILARMVMVNIERKIQ